MAPKKYRFVVSMTKPGQFEEIKKLSDEDSELLPYHLIDSARMQMLLTEQGDQLYPALCTLTKNLLEVCDSNDLGSLEVNKTVTFRGSNGLNNERKINSVIICGKKNKKSPNVSSLSKKEINWSHTWEVKGHWRVCSGLGKNRDGEYSVSGFTWVVNHTKGVGDLVIKSRVFNAQENGPTNS